MNSAAAPVITDGTHKSQNGFVKGRQLLQNVVDLDSLARIYGMWASDHNKRIPDSSTLQIAMLVFSICVPHFRASHMLGFVLSLRRLVRQHGTSISSDVSIQVITPIT